MHGTFSSDLLNATSKANSIDFSNSILYSNATVSVLNCLLLRVFRRSSLRMSVYRFIFNKISRSIGTTI